MKNYNIKKIMREIFKNASREEKQKDTFLDLMVERGQKRLNKEVRSNSVCYNQDDLCESDNCRCGK